MLISMDSFTLNVMIDDIMPAQLIHLVSILHNETSGTIIKYKGNHRNVKTD